MWKKTHFSGPSALKMRDVMTLPWTINLVSAPFVLQYPSLAPFDFQMSQRSSAHARDVRPQSIPSSCELLTLLTNSKACTRLQLWRSARKMPI